MAVNIPDVRGAFFQAWEANGNDPTQAEPAYQAFLRDVRSDAWDRFVAEIRGLPNPYRAEDEKVD